MDAGAAFAGLDERRDLEHVMAEADDRARDVGQRLRPSQQDLRGFPRTPCVRSAASFERR